MELSMALCVIAGFIFAGVIKGATGIGYSSCALPFLVCAVGLQPALAMLVVPAMACNLAVVFSVGHLRSTVQEFWPLYVAMLPGIVVGVFVLTRIDQQLATRALGLLILAYGVVSIAKPHFRVRASIARSLQVPVGLTNGFLTGLTGSQIMPLMPYMLSLELDTQKFVQAVNLAVIAASVSMGLCLMTFGLMKLDVLALSIVAVVPALVGVQIGVWCRTHINDQQFRQLVIVSLMGIGVVLMVR